MKNEQNAPKIRFKGFTDAWELRKFSDIAETRRGLTYKPTNTVNNGVRVLRSSNINEDTFVFGNEDVFVDENAVNIPFVQNGDILITSANGSSRLVGKHAIIRNLPKSSAVHGGFMLIASCSNPDFLNASLGSQWYSEFLSLYVAGGNGAIGNLNKNDLDAQAVLVPSTEEQRQIGTYFRTLDHLITLHQRKCETLQKLKKSMLQKMFPKNGSCFPEIRFAGFTDAWELRELGEIANRITRKNQNLESTLPLTISAQYGLIDQNEFFDKRIASKDVSGYYLLKKGEFAYNKSYSSDAPWGAIKRLDKYENGVLSTLYIIFEIKDKTKTDSDFIVSYYDTDRWHKEVQSVAAEGARNHGLLNISPNDFFETVLTIPKSVEEQRQIGIYFRTLDHLITLHQRKLETLKKLKKAMLQKMFI